MQRSIIISQLALDGLIFVGCSERIFNMASPKSFLGPLFERARNVTDILILKRTRAKKWQDKTLRKMLYRAQSTAFGEFYDFDTLIIAADPIEQFKKTVPITDYEGMHNWWQREYEGEDNITWPGSTKYFALSSGTIQGASKFIPVTGDQLKSIMRASRRQLFAIARTDVPKDFFTKDYLMIGGSTDLNFDGQKYSGDLSGITTRNLPFWIEKFAKPTEEIKREKDWHQKLEIMVREAPNWDVAMVAGGPAWVKMLFERIIARYNLKNIHEIWPHLSIYTWGAVSLTPYREQIDALLGKPIHYFETYLASEGFIAYQTKLSSAGMGLVFRNNMYFEFLPFNSNNFLESGEVKQGVTTLDIDEVEMGVDYAIVISTAAGAWRYLIGDVIQFTDVDACEIKITGRTKQYLSLCGEHLSVENMNNATKVVSQKLGFAISEFTVRGLKYANGEVGHRWFLTYPNGMKMPDAEAVKLVLDEALIELNDDYATERKHILKRMDLFMLPESDFLDFMDHRGKLGGQAKFPRVMPELVYTEWIEFLCSRYQRDTFA